MKIKEKRELSFIAYDKARLFERRGQKAAVFWKKTTATTSRSPKCTTR
jgi:hypothetical protein